MSGGREKDERSSFHEPIWRRRTRPDGMPRPVAIPRTSLRWDTIVHAHPFYPNSNLYLTWSNLNQTKSSTIGCGCSLHYFRAKFDRFSMVWLNWSKSDVAYMSTLLPRYVC
jgi:hypothetical protein